MRQPPNLDPRLWPLVQELRAVLREKDVDLQDVDAAKGWSKGYLSQLVNGHVDLKLAQLYDALEVAQVSPRDFFRRFVGEEPRIALDEVLRRLAALEQQRANGESG